MTNQERAMQIALSLQSVETSYAVVKPILAGTAGGKELELSLKRHHQALLDHATAMAAALELDVAALSLGNSK